MAYQSDCPHCGRYNTVPLARGLLREAKTPDGVFAFEGYLLWRCRRCAQEFTTRERNLPLPRRDLWSGEDPVVEAQLLLEACVAADIAPAEMARTISIQPTEVRQFDFLIACGVVPPWKAAAIVERRSLIRQAFEKLVLEHRERKEETSRVPVKTRQTAKGGRVVVPSRWRSA